MAYIFKPMNAQYAQAIVNWHYEPPYDFYDMDQDPEDRFQPRETFMQPTNGSVFEFLKMTMPD